MPARRNLHDLTHSPQALYQFNDTSNWMADTSGNGKTLVEGSPGVAVPGWVGVARYFNNTDASNSESPYWDNVGAISVYAMVAVRSTVSNPTSLFRVTGGSSRDYWALSIGDHWNQLFQYSHHDSGGNPDTVSLSMYIPTPFMWLGFTRDSAGTGIKLFVNGDVVASGTTGAVPGNHTTGVLTVGASGNAGYFIQSLKIVGSELSEVQMQAEYSRCFGLI